MSNVLTWGEGIMLPWETSFSPVLAARRRAEDGDDGEEEAGAEEDFEEDEEYDEDEEDEDNDDEESDDDEDDELDYDEMTDDEEEGEGFKPPKRGGRKDWE